METTRSDALALKDAAGPALEDLLRTAARVRDDRWGRVATYSRKVFIPLTTLCRDECWYCVFARPPGAGGRYLSPDEVLEIAEKGRRLGCKEALFSLGERPETRYPEAREALRRLGHRTTLEYLRAMCDAVLHETGLVPHANPGAMDLEEMRSLVPVTGSMGTMIETVAERLTRPGQVHYRCPDKHPRRRLLTLEAAGRLRVPFTTGILIGIGETWEERVDSILAIAESHRRHGHVQEVIVQNFRAKPETPMAGAPEPDLVEMLRTLAVARLLLPPEIGLQAPPNLMAETYARYLEAGINDWGGVSPLTLDHINPEAAWPKIAELAAATASKGMRLRERLTVYPRYVAEAEAFLAPEVRPYVEALAGPDGFPREQVLQ